MRVDMWRDCIAKNNNKKILFVNPPKLGTRCAGPPPPPQSDGSGQIGHVATWARGRRLAGWRQAGARPPGRQAGAGRVDHVDHVDHVPAGAGRVVMRACGVCICGQCGPCKKQLSTLSTK